MDIQDKLEGALIRVGVSMEKRRLYNTYLLAVFETFNINTPLRQVHFLAQVLHESNLLNYVKENLNYSAEGLIKTWPRYFNADNAGTYARNPQKIANRAYANRMGNGDEASGDGWRYIGRGLIQITGKVNYQECSSALFSSFKLLENPEWLEEPMYATESAGWYWESRGLNASADKDDILTITKKINGGFNGLDDRKAKLAVLKKEIL